MNFLDDLFVPFLQADAPTHQTSYSQLPLLPPAADLETKKILRQTIASARALADLKGIAAKIPNQAVLVSGIVLQ
jgi:hypothetical protein